MLRLSGAALCLCLLMAFQANVFLGSCSSANVAHFGKHLREAFVFFFALLRLQKSQRLKVLTARMAGDRSSLKDDKHSTSWGFWWACSLTLFPSTPSHCDAHWCDRSSKLQTHPILQPRSSVRAMCSACTQVWHYVFNPLTIVCSTILNCSVGFLCCWSVVLIGL